MTAAAVAFDGTRHDAADTLGTIWTDLGGGKAVAETAFVYQGVASVSEKVGTSELGVALDLVTGVDFTTPRVWIAKHIATNSGELNVLGATGGILEMGSGGLRINYDRYYVIGSDTYPLKGGWLITPIDPNGGNQSARPGTAPTLTALDYFGWACTFTIGAKAENVAMDAVDSITYGTGLSITLGNGVSADGSFADFVAFDEDAAASGNNRYGIVSTANGVPKVLYVTGTLQIGDSGGTETDFSDSNKVLVFPDALFLNSTGFFGLTVHAQNALSVIAITDCAFISNGTTGGTVDTRGVYTVSGTTGAVTFTGCNFDVYLSITLTSAATMASCNFLNGAAMTQAGGTLTGCAFSGGTGGAGAVALLVDDVSKVTGTDFTSAGTGHGIRYRPTGAGPFNVSLSGSQFSAYAASDGSTGNEAILIDPVTATADITLNITGGGSTPSIMEAAAYTGTFVLVVAPRTHTFKAVDSDGAAIEGARVLVWADPTSGSMKADAAITSIVRSGSTATVTTTAAHGLATGDVVLIEDTVESGALDAEAAYTGTKTITVTGGSAFTFTVVGTPTTPATRTYHFSEVIINNALTNASGVVTDTRSYSVDQAITGNAKKGTAAPTYKSQNISGTVSSSTDTTVTVPMTSDD